MPFGDDELYQVYLSYRKFLSLRSRDSFLTDIGVPAGDVTSSTHNINNNDERKMLLQAIEQKILPPKFGNRLYQVAFLRHSDTSEYADGTEGNAQQQQELDEYARMARLEAFFEGVSNCSRRGAKATLKILVACCQPQAIENNGQPTQSNDPFSTTKSNSQMTTCIQPLELVDIGYRVALATAFLQAVARNDEDEDVTQFLPPPEASKSPGLLALANSLIECATRRQQRTQRSMIPNGSDRVSVVDLADVMEWAEQVAPLFASSLSTFSHLVFFPNRPYPPTRTSFDFPRFLVESTFFDHGSSPLLFSFGCMSSSLNGEVSPSIRINESSLVIAPIRHFTN